MNGLRVVLDTNIYISGLVFGGVPRAVLVLARAATFVLCVSAPIRDEVESTLSEKFSWPTQRIQQACGPFWKIAHVVKPTTSLALIPADPDDDRILECAVDGEAGIIVTGDDHLLRLNQSPKQPPIDRIRILTPRQFLDEQNS
jgi:putative PIN family toxin of toxin-antitoxin system